MIEGILSGLMLLGDEWYSHPGLGKVSGIQSHWVVAAGLHARIEAEVPCNQIHVPVSGKIGCGYHLP